jgi:transcription termination factor Rho
MFNIETLRSKSDSELAKITKDLGVKLAKTSTENDKVFAILDFQASNTKVAKDYYNATEIPMNKEENSASVAKKAIVKKPVAKKKIEKPIEEKVEPSTETTENAVAMVEESNAENLT